MVYKKYTSDGNKRYGPYYYKSKRVGEEVVTTYLGKNEKKRIDKIFLFLFVAILIVGVIALASLFVSLSSTGKVSSNLENIVYSPGENLAGIVSFNVREGELIPENAKIIITNGQQTKELSLSKLSPLTSVVYGNYYAEGSSLSGNGGGYGFIGKKKVYPEVDFQLLVSNVREETENQSTPIEPTPNEIPEPSISNETPESSVSENLEQPAPSNEGSDGVQITGNSVIENAYVLDARTTRGQDYVYNVEQGQSVELVKGSVKYNGSEIGDDKVSLNLDNNVARVSTDYFVYEPGFGRDYLGDYVSTLNLDLGSAGIVAEDSNVYIKIVYGETVILSTERDIIVSENQTSEINLSLAVIKEIPMLRLVKDSSYDLDLSEYFINAESYDFELDNVSGLIEGSILTLQADSGFKGMSRGKVIAHSGEDSVRLDLVVMVSSGAVNIKTSSSRIKVGEPVKWQKNVSLEVPEQVVVEVPKEAENIVVKPIEELGASNGLTGFISADVRFWKESKFNRFLRNVFSVFTGRAVDELSGDNSSLSGNIELNLIDNATQYTIEYETPGPVAIETETETGKQVVISAPDELNYTDVLAFTNISEVYSVGEENKIKLYWVESEIYIPFDAYDMDGNGKIDYLEWIVPHLSNQTFDVIYNSSSLTIYDCGNITEAGTYTLNQSIEQIGGGDCLLIQSDNVTINGSDGNGGRYTITGNVNGDGIADAANGFSFNVINVIIEGDVLSKGANSTGDYGGNGGNISINASVAWNVISQGGEGIGGPGPHVGGSGGFIIVTDSNLSNISSLGGRTDNDGNGGNGGQIILTNVNASVVSSNGGNSYFGNGNGGTGGVIEIYNSSVFFVYGLGGSGDSLGSNGGNGGNVTFDPCPYSVPTVDVSGGIGGAGNGANGTITPSYCYAGYDVMAPLIEFNDTITPLNGSTLTINNFNVSMVTSDDRGDHYAFLNFNNSLVGWWRGENNANDSSGNGNNGTWAGSDDYVTGRFGQAMSFDGESCAYDIVAVPDMSGNKNFTISFWMSPHIISDTVAGFLGYNYGFASIAVIGIASNQFYGGLGSGAGDIYSGITPVVDQWYHTALTFDGNILTFYVNGSKVGNVSGTANLLNSVFGVGCARHVLGINDYRFNGKVDEFLIFDRPLSASEVASLYNATANQYNNNFTVLSNGNYTIKGYAVNSAGNVNSTEERTIDFNDMIAPIITIYSPTNTIYLNSSLLINFTAEDNFAVDSLWYNNGTENVSYTAPVNITLNSGEYTFTFYVNDSYGNENSTAVSFNVTSYKAITTLHTGWNMFAVQTNETASDEDVNISLVANKYNLVGLSTDSNVSLETRTVQQQSQGLLGRLSALLFGIQSTEESDVDFTLSNGTEVTWDSAASRGKVKKYLAYYDTSNSSAKKYKYAGFQDSSLRGNKGYWVYATEAGNLTLKGVGGSQAGSYVPVSDLRFSNGTLTLNYDDAVWNYGWIDSDQLMQYRLVSNPLNNGTWAPVESRQPEPNVIYPWEGLVIKMNVDNITIYAPN